MLGFQMNQGHLVATIVFSLILGANAYRYKEAKNWGKQYPQCNGKNQSPIILNSVSFPGYPNISESLKLKEFNKLPRKITLRNTGHIVEMKADWSGETPSFTGGPLHKNYVYEKTTFHWAQKRWMEEVQDPRPYLKYQAWQQADMHIFFYRSDLKSFEKAETQKGGLAVFKLGLKTGYSNPDHCLDNVEKIINQVQSINSTAEVPPFPLLNIVAEIDIPFLFYEGSLDYPPCSESVTWFVYSGGVPITDNLLKEFRKIKLAEGDKSNVRPTQALNKRQVKEVYNFDISDNMP